MREARNNPKDRTTNIAGAITDAGGNATKMVCCTLSESIEEQYTRPMREVHNNPNDRTTTTADTISDVSEIVAGIVCDVLYFQSQ